MVKNPVRRARVRRLVGSVAVSFVVVPAAMAAVVATAGPASAAPHASTSVRWNGVAPAGRWNIAPTGRWNGITPDCGRWNGTPPVNA